MADRTVVFGGTFSPVHAGHRALLHRAFQTASHDGPGAGHVLAGLTSTELARQTRRDPSHADTLGTFDDRRATFASTLHEVGAAYTAAHEIVRIDDPGGPAETRADVDALVVSPEAAAQRRAYLLNGRRVDEGLPPLQVYTPPFVVAADGDRISSTRVRNGEIDEFGRVLDEPDG